MASGREGHQEERFDLQTDPAFGEREKELLAAIYGAPFHLGGVKAKLAMLEKSFDVAALEAMVTGATTASLVQHWIKNHVPTTQIEEISILASAVLGDKDKAVKWLSEPNLAMDSRPPIDLVGEKDGFDRVKNLLLRIEYGALA